MLEVRQRVFYYNQVRLDDPDLSLSPEEVKDFYSDVYPELAQGVIEGPDLKEEGAVYTLRKAVGTKGAGITVTEIAKGKVPFSFDPVEVKEEFSLMETLARALKDSDGDSILPPHDALGMI